MEQVPYLGVLPNEGGWQDLYNIFLEPATGPLDRLDVARLHGQHSTVAGGSVYEWHLTLRLSRTRAALPAERTHLRQFVLRSPDAGWYGSAIFAVNPPSRKITCPVRNSAASDTM